MQNTENIDDNDDGDGGPSKCYLYKTKRCEYQDKDSEPSRTMKWIGCDFLSCSNTFHEKCVGLSFSNVTCDQALFSFRSVKHSGGTGETKNRA